MNETNELFTPDFSEDTGFTTAPEGKYTLQVAGPPRWRVSKSEKSAGTPYLSWEFSILNAEGNYGRIFETTMLGGKGVSRFIQTLHALGLSRDDAKKVQIKKMGGDDPKRGAPVDLYLNGDRIELVGKTFDALLFVEEREDFEPRNRIRKFA